jgi:hypothetical protein
MGTQQTAQAVRTAPVEVWHTVQAVAAYGRRLGDIPGTETVYRMRPDGSWHVVKAVRP